MKQLWVAALALAAWAILAGAVVLPAFSDDSEQVLSIDHVV